MIEVKTDKYEYIGIEEKVARLVNETDWPFRHAYCSFNFHSLERLAKIEPTAQFDLLLSTSKKKVTLAEAAPLIEGIHPKFDWYVENLEKMRTFSKAVRCWTVKEEEQMIQCFNSPIDAFITDFPEKALRIKQTMKK